MRNTIFMAPDAIEEVGVARGSKIDIDSTATPRNFAEEDPMPARIEERNDRELLYIALDPHAIPDHAAFPHPLIAVDYDADDNLIGLSASAPFTDAALTIYRDWRASGANTDNLVSLLSRASELVTA